MITRRKLLQLLGIGGTTIAVAPKVITEALKDAKPNQIGPIVVSQPQPLNSSEFVLCSGQMTSRVVKVRGKERISPLDHIKSNGDGTVSRCGKNDSTIGVFHEFDDEDSRIWEVNIW